MLHFHRFLNSLFLVYCFHRSVNKSIRVLSGLKTCSALSDISGRTENVTFTVWSLQGKNYLFSFTCSLWKRKISPSSILLPPCSLPPLSCTSWTKTTALCWLHALCETEGQQLFTDTRSKDRSIQQKKNVILQNIFGLESLFRSQVPFSDVFKRNKS